MGKAKVAAAPLALPPSPIPLPPDVQEICLLLATRAKVMAEKFHRVNMSTFDAEQRLRDLDVRDEDLTSLLWCMHLDIDEIRRDIERIGELGNKAKGSLRDAWLQKQLDDLTAGGPA